MGVGLARFMLSVMTARLNNRSSADFWLPGRLQSLSGADGLPLLPLRNLAVDVGELQGQEGLLFSESIKSQWWLTLKKPGKAGHRPVADPASPWPSLAFSAVSVTGLENAIILPDPVITEITGGYAMTLTLKFGSYGPDTGLAPLSTAGDYNIRQGVCSAADPATAPVVNDGFASEIVNGDGTFAADYHNAFVDVSLRLTVTGAGLGRGLDLVVNRIDIRGPEPVSAPDIMFRDLTVDSKAWMARNVWLKQAQTLMERPEGRAGLIGALSATLNSADNRQVLARELTARLSLTLDDALGAGSDLPDTTGSSERGAIDTFVFDRLLRATRDVGHDFFLPRLIAGSSNPSLEPFAGSDITIGDCEISDGLTLKDIKVASPLLRGLSNALPNPAGSATTVAGFRLTVDLSSIPGGVVIVNQASIPPPAPLTLSAGLSTWLDGDPEDPIEGTWEISAARAEMLTNVRCSATTLEDLTLTIESIAVTAPADGVSVRTNFGSQFGDTIDAALTRHGAAAISTVNAELPGQRDAIGAALTDQVRAALISRLGA